MTPVSEQVNRPNNHPVIMSLPSSTSARLFLGVIVLLELFLIGMLLHDRRIVLHDSFLRLSVQYFLMNNAVYYGELPQWIPYFTHGANALPWYSSSNINGLLLYGLTLFAGILKSWNFLGISYCGIFVDKLILLCGTLLLSNRIYSSRLTSIFVAVSILGSSIWLTQPFHLIYGIPLLLYFFHRWIESGKWTFMFWGLNFLVIQSLGQVAYFIPIVTLTIFVYAVSLGATCPNNVRQLAQGDSWEKITWIPLLLSLISAGALFFVWNAGINGGNIVRLVSGRNPDGSVALQEFLSYGGKFNPWKLFELVWGISVERDYTLYIGTLAFIMLIIGILWGGRRKTLPMYSTTLILFLICMGTFLANIAYFGWPLMKFYRNLPLLITPVRLLFCFIAGFGLEGIFAAYSRTSPSATRLKCLIIFLVAVIGVLLALTVFSKLNVLLAKAMGYKEILDPSQQERIISAVITQNVWSIVKCGFLLVVFTLLLFIARDRKPLVLSGLLLFSLVDVYSYKYHEYRKRSLPMSSEQYRQFRFQPLQYQARRRIFDWNGNVRSQIISRPLLAKGAHYWTLNALLLYDTLDTPLRTDYWQKAFDDYIGFWDKDIIKDKVSNNLAGILWISPNNIVLNKLSGVSEDKIQFFRHAHLLTDRRQFADVLNNPDFKGDDLFLSVKAGEPMPMQAATVWSLGNKIGDERIKYPYTVESFQANRLRLYVEVKGDHPVWMIYADVWHPQWKAKVNGKPQAIYRAQMAYKAVLLHPGKNIVEFFYGSNIIKICLNILAANAWLWIMFCFKKLAICHDPATADN